MSTEQRYRMTVDCPECLGCKVAAAINLRYPEGFTPEEALNIAATLYTTGSAVMVASGAGTGEFASGEMPMRMASRFVSEWSPPQ